MSTLSEQIAAKIAAEKAKPKKKTKAKRDDNGRFVKDESDLDTPLS